MMFPVNEKKEYQPHHTMKNLEIQNKRVHMSNPYEITTQLFVNYNTDILSCMTKPTTAQAYQDKVYHFWEWSVPHYVTNKEKKQ